MKSQWKLALAVAVIGSGGAFAWRQGAKGDRPDFREVKVKRGDLAVTVLATGAVQPQNRVQIKPPIAGRVEDILVREGQFVKKGQILAWMSSTERAALLDAARAKGPEELTHWEDLYKAAPLVAPLGGLVISRNMEPGQSVTSGDAVLVLSDRLIVKAQVDETDIGRVNVGQEAEIVLDAYPQSTIASRVDHVAFEARTINNVTIYQVEVMPQRVPDFMKSGMTANVTFHVSRKRGVLLLPADAVREEEGRTVVLVPDPEGKGRPRPHEVKTLASDGKRVEVVSGLSEGDTVLVRAFRLPKGAAASSPFSPFGSRRPRGEGRSGRGEGGGRGSVQRGGQ